LAPACLVAQCLDFTLSRKNPGFRRIARVKVHAEAAELMPLSIDEHDLRRQPHPGHEPGYALHRIVRRKPRRDDPAYRGLHRLDVVGERFQPDFAL